MWALVLGRGGFEPPKALGQLIYSQSRLTASVSARPGDFTDIAPGETRAVAAAWIRFPSLEVERLDQSYERLDERRYRYRSGLFTADLLVDDDAMVLQYGVNWKAVATGAKHG